MDLFSSKMNGGSANTTPMSLYHSRSRYPLGTEYPPFDPLTMDPTVIQYYRGNVQGLGVGGGVGGGDILSPTLDAFASPTIDSKKFRQLLNISSARGGASSPLSSIDNLQTPPSKSPLFSTPVKVEEDVIVMDGILLNTASPVSRGSGSGRSIAFDSGSPSGNDFKTEICRFWEDHGNCRLGSRCQYAHGKEELRPTPTYRRNKPEGIVCRTFAQYGSCQKGTRCRFLHTAASGRALAGMRMEEVSRRQSSSVNYDKANVIGNSNKSSMASDWSPIDDGIDVLPSEAPKTREYVDALIDDRLYRRFQHRLPVFKEMCS